MLWNINEEKPLITGNKLWAQASNFWVSSLFSSGTHASLLILSQNSARLFLRDWKADHCVGTSWTKWGWNLTIVVLCGCWIPGWRQLCGPGGSWSHWSSACYWSRRPGGWGTISASWHRHPCSCKKQPMQQKNKKNKSNWLLSGAMVNDWFGKTDKLKTKSFDRQTLTWASWLLCPGPICLTGYGLTSSLMAKVSDLWTWIVGAHVAGPCG